MFPPSVKTTTAGGRLLLAGLLLSAALVGGCSSLIHGKPVAAPPAGPAEPSFPKAKPSIPSAAPSQPGPTNANAPSRFVLEIPAELQAAGSEWVRARGLPTTERAAAEEREVILGLELKAGDEIEHAKFGRGIVSNVDGDEVSVTFPQLGTKRLSLSFAPIRKV